MSGRTPVQRACSTSEVGVPRRGGHLSPSSVWWVSTYSLEPIAVPDVTFNFTFVLVVGTPTRRVTKIRLPTPPSDPDYGPRLLPHSTHSKSLSTVHLPCRLSHRRSPPSPHPSTLATPPVPLHPCPSTRQRGTGRNSSSPLLLPSCRNKNSVLEIITIKNCIFSNFEPETITPLYRPPLHLRHPICLKSPC